MSNPNIFISKFYFFFVVLKEDFMISINFSPHLEFKEALDAHLKPENIF